MATILIVEDRPIDRKLLAKTLGSCGHQVVETSDGEEALRVLTNVRPDVVISDILMPTVDGFEFVRRMREIPLVAATPVIFYTATYHEREARALAGHCGVIDILTKPSSAATIQATIDRALDSIAEQSGVRVDRPTVDRDHLHLVSSAFARTSNRVELLKEQMEAVDKGAQQVAAERDPWALFTMVCDEARQITLAQHAIVGLLAENGSASDTLFTSGVADAIAIGLKPPSVATSALSAVVTQRQTVRTRNPDGRPEALGLPREHPRVSSLLMVPIASPSRVYGWLSLRNKLGAEEFTEGDEHAAITLGTHAGISYETHRQLDALRRQLALLENELGQRLGDDQAIREEERSRLARMLHDGLGQAQVALKMDLHRLASTLHEGENGTRMAAILRNLDEMIQSVRTLAADLRPSRPGTDSVLAGIELEARAFERRSGIRCRVNARIEQVQMNADRSTLALSIVREALSNVLRHACATRVTVSAEKSATALTVSIADNGRGIAAAAIAGTGSLGLIGMRERAELLGGTFDVRTRRPRGTVVEFTIDLADRYKKPRERS